MTDCVRQLLLSGGNLTADFLWIWAFKNWGSLVLTIILNLGFRRAVFVWLITQSRTSHLCSQLHSPSIVGISGWVFGGGLLVFPWKQGLTMLLWLALNSKRHTFLPAAEVWALCFGLLLTCTFFFSFFLLPQSFCPSVLCCVTPIQMIP